MIKRCKNCGNTLDVNAGFCDTCGGTDFIVLNDDGTPYVAQNSYPNQNQAQNYNAQQNFNAQQSFNNQPVNNIPVKAKKDKKTMILSAVAILVFGILVILGFNLKSRRFANKYIDKSAKTTLNFEITTKPTVPYSKGTFDGKTYINEWANLKITVPDDFVSVEPPAASEEGNYKSEVVAQANNTTDVIQIMICDFDAEDAKGLSNGEIIDSLFKKIKETEKNAFDSFLYSTYAKAYIAGKEYIYFDCSLSKSSQDFKGRVYATVIENHIIVLSQITTGSEIFDINTITSTAN